MAKKERFRLKVEEVKPKTGFWLEDLLGPGKVVSFRHTEPNGTVMEMKLNYDQLLMYLSYTHKACHNYNNVIKIYDVNYEID
jgi:hypothetical protein